VTRTDGLPPGRHSAEPFLHGSKSDIGAVFKKGQRMMIGGRLFGTGYTTSRTWKCYFTGGIGLILLA
jgi:hypothetical protein